jgi:thiamine biosynthesis lipoprotein
MLTRETGGQFRWSAMHSPVQLQLPGMDDLPALAVARAVVHDFEVSEQALSRFCPSAELVQLNAVPARWTRVSPRLYTALSTAFRAYRRTGGLFDPRVLERLEALGYAGAPHPSGPFATGQAWLERRPRPREVRACAALDLGGIGKGLGVRWAARIVARVARNFLLNAGGDLVVAGEGPDGRGWQVGIEDPQRKEDIVAVLRLPERGAVCTSSIAVHRWLQGDTFVHHLLDPRTGEPGGQGLLAVTVVARDPAWAEVSSKVLFLHGRGAIAQACTGQAALWIASDGEIGMSDAMRPFVIWRRRG